jgi:GntR family transcriptional regulator / MocR family aminotransferase
MAIAPDTLWKRLYTDLRSALESGAIPAGMKLPSSRLMAVERGVSRSTVILVYDQLLAEGFLESRRGSGTWASASARKPVIREKPATPANVSDRISPIRPATPGVLAGPGFGPLDATKVDFRTGLPAVRLFPWDLWDRAARISRGRFGKRLLEYGPPEGLPELREAIAAYLERTKGLETRADSLVVTSGTTQTLGLVALLLARAGTDTAILEKPVSRDVAEIMEERGLQVRYVGVDASGLRIDEIPEDLGKSLVVTTPSHQFPTGAVLSLERRRALVGRAGHSASWILEDDYDGEFRYSGKPLATLSSLDDSRTIYAQSFSKTLAPGLRLAFARLPAGLMQGARVEKWRIDLHSPTFEQGTLAVFLGEGWYDAHVYRMRKRYAKLRDILVESLSRIDGLSPVGGTSAGMHLVARLEEGTVDPRFLSACETEGVKIYPISLYTPGDEGPRPDFALGFGHLDEAEIMTGCERLKRAINISRGSVGAGPPRRN